MENHDSSYETEYKETWDQHIEEHYPLIADFKEYIGPKLKYRKQNGKWEQRTIYIVNMSEKQTDGKLVIYQVEDVVKQWNTGPKIQVGSEREKHVRALYEKVDKRREQRKEKLSKK